ncbi:hypothetical protein KGF54_004310 [Candida jiufengensis]|uniref:uncharacterized protein n=1 Tax=Candida jiufengensis TaxID=497108 RepID=UPI0022251148|nr:uncharacterized protein KGF54_004310 [Candida jiufengensis]KAI5951236.1 hypothetical protein KGF54_004310 [Candida jiufengensis]
MSLFSDYKTVNRSSTNYAVAISVGVQILSVIYYFIRGYERYSVPKFNLDEANLAEGSSSVSVDEVRSDEKV